jgi:hypothetical protein
MAAVSSTKPESVASHELHGFAHGMVLAKLDPLDFARNVARHCNRPPLFKRVIRRFAWQHPPTS